MFVEKCFDESNYVLFYLAGKTPIPKKKKGVVLIQDGPDNTLTRCQSLWPVSSPSHP